MFTCELQSDTSIEWFNSIITASTLLVAIATAIASTRVARNANIRADKAESRALRERLGNDLVAEFDTFAGAPFLVDVPDSKTFITAVYPYRESLDEDEPDERILKAAMKEALRLATEIQVYSFYQVMLLRKPIPKDERFKIEAIAASLGDAVRNVVQGFQYSNKENRRMQVCKRFAETIERLTKESSEIMHLRKKDT